MEIFENGNGYVGFGEGKRKRRKKKEMETRKMKEMEWAGGWIMQISRAVTAGTRRVNGGK